MVRLIFSAFILFLCCLVYLAFAGLILCVEFLLSLVDILIQFTWPSHTAYMLLFGLAFYGMVKLAKRLP